MSSSGTDRSAAPAVSVGMPVYNSAAWVESAIESILSQTHRDLELVISDNASTDNTYALCEPYARADARVRLLRNEVNIGANGNYLAVLRAARGEYFKWAASNDLCAPTFIERCVAALRADADAVLACPRTSLFENTVNDAQPYDRDVVLESPEPAVRFVELQNQLGLNNAFNGVIRRSALNTALPMGTYIGADVVLMGELALLGKFLLVDERLFYRRMTAASATRLKSEREVERHLVPTAKSPLKLQRWRYQLGLLRSARSVALFSRDWLQTVNYGLRSFIWSRRTLASELLRAMRP